jgi:mannose/cellobiose epimerase-like protein (N-acyl-D-glucosamine 2-epimerase family)
VDELTEEIEALKLSQKKRRGTDTGGMSSLLKELNGIDEAKDGIKTETLETAESEGTNTQRRRSSIRKSKDQMFQLLNKHFEDKKDPKKQEEKAAKNKESDKGVKRMKELEKKLSGMTKMMATLQRTIKEEKKKNVLTKKQMSIKDHEIDALREKLLQTTLGYSDIMNDLNE